MTRMLLLIFMVVFAIPGFVLAADGDVTITGIVPGCGDEVIQDGEECDGTNLNTQSCSTKGFSTGTLLCASNCVFNTIQCSTTSSSTSGGGGGGGGGIGQIIGFVESILLPPALPSDFSEVTLAQARELDIVKDGAYNIFDFNAMMIDWSSTACGTAADIDKNCRIDVYDFNILMVLWGVSYQI